jgi:hypothetical protein
MLYLFKNLKKHALGLTTLGTYLKVKVSYSLTASRMRTDLPPLSQNGIPRHTIALNCVVLSTIHVLITIHV